MTTPRLMRRSKNKKGWEHDEAGVVMLTKIVMRKLLLLLLLVLVLVVVVVVVVVV